MLCISYAGRKKRMVKAVLYQPGEQVEPVPAEDTQTSDYNDFNNQINIVLFHFAPNKTKIFFRIKQLRFTQKK